MFFPIRSYMWFDTDDKAGGGGTVTAEPTQTPAEPAVSGSQTDYQAMYTELSQKITNGEYVTKASYAAQQAKYQTLFDDHQKLTQAQKDYESQLSALKLDYEKTSTELETIGKTVTEKDTELSTTQSELQRMKIIMRDYPQLVPFEVEEGGSLLPQVDLDKLPEALEKFSEKLNQVGSKKTADELAGATKKPKGKEDLTKRTADIAKSEMNAAMARGDLVEYEAKRAEYFKLLEVPEADASKVIPE